MSNDNSVLPYTIMDNADAEQIMKNDDVRQALSYNVGKTKALSFAGVKMLYIEWLKHESRSSKVVIEGTFCNLEKDDPEDKHTWQWRSQALVRTEKIDPDGNPKYNETLGYGERSYLFMAGQTRQEKVGKYNEFGKRTAAGMAIRNAIRQQMPETQILVMLNRLEGTADMQTLQQQQPPQTQRASEVQQQQPQAPPQQQQQASPPPPPTQTKQEPPAKLQGDGNTRVCSICKLTITARTVEWQGQRKLQWQNPNGRPHYLPPRTGADGKPIFECRPFNEEPQPETAQAAPTPPSSSTTPSTTADPNIKWCECMEAKPRWETSPQDGKHHCYDCDLPVTQEQCDVLLKNGGKK